MHLYFFMLWFWCDRQFLIPPWWILESFSPPLQKWGISISESDKIVRLLFLRPSPFGLLESRDDLYMQLHSCICHTCLKKRITWRKGFKGRWLRDVDEVGLLVCLLDFTLTWITTHFYVTWRQCGKWESHSGPGAIRLCFQHKIFKIKAGKTILYL